MSYDPGKQQIPILCKTCMGPAEPALDGTIACPYCGAKDRLPADELGRALELKRRLAAAAASVLQMRGLESGLSHVFESRGAFLRAAGLFLLLAPVVLVYSVAVNWETLSRTPPAFRLSSMVYLAMGPLFVGGLGLAVCIALLVGRRSYHKRVREHLFAHAPREAGRPARCRACDGELPDRRDPFIVCEYCSTSNLVTPELQRDRERLLAAEEGFYRQRSNRATAAMASGGSRMTRTLIVSIALVYLAMIALGFLASALLPKA